MNTVRVVNVRGLRTPEQRAGVVYVGRAFAGWPAHPLANPFRIESPPPGEERFGYEIEARRRCIERYKAHLLDMPADELARLLDDLWEQTGHGRLPLGCWCSPDPCHADVLAGLLGERIAEGKDRE